MGIQTQSGIFSPPSLAAGNVYWVKKASDADYNLFVEQHQQVYFDGTNSVYNTIQAAVNACSDKRGDVILVCAPDYGTASANTKWNENVYIAKAGVKIFALTNYWENQCRPSDATTKYPFTPLTTTATSGAMFYVIARGVEIAGFLFDGGGGYTGVYIGDGYNVAGLNALGYTSQNSASAWIHDCYFRGGSEGQYGAVLDGCSANVMIERCIFERHTVSSIYIQPGGSRTCQMPIIRNNEFWAANSGRAIDMYASADNLSVLVRENSFRDGPSLTYTLAVRFTSTGVHSAVGNYFACTNKISGSATDFLSGNYSSDAGNSVAYVNHTGA